MVELIIEETGFPKNRETLQKFQDSFKIPIRELLRQLPGNRILSGWQLIDAHGFINLTAGLLIYQGKIWTAPEYNGVNPVVISFFEVTNDYSFNVGTQANPIYDQRPGEIVRSIQYGNVPGNVGVARIDSFFRGRRALEYLRAASLFVGPILVSTRQRRYRAQFNSIGTQDYQVIANFRPADPSIQFSRAFVWDINNRSETGFDIVIDNAVQNSVPLMFDYTIIPINRPELLTIATD